MFAGSKDFVGLVLFGTSGMQHYNRDGFWHSGAYYIEQKECQKQKYDSHLDLVYMYVAHTAYFRLYVGECLTA